MKVRVAVNAQSGRHLVASEAVKAGELLLIERAFAFAVIPSQLTSHVLRLKPETEGGAAEGEEEGEGEDGCCFHCLRQQDPEAPVFTPMPCSGCEYAHCSAECRERLSRFHQAECSLVAPLLAAAERHNCQPDELRYLLMALRMVISAHDPSLLDPLRSLTTPPTFPSFPSPSSSSSTTSASASSSSSSPKLVLRSSLQLVESLQANEELHATYESELILNARKLANVLLEALPSDLLGDRFTRSGLVRAFLSFNVNCYALGECGVGLFFFGALASHSCAQNASFVDLEEMPGCKALRALADLPAGAELSISYLGSDLVMPTFLRRQKLLSSQLFWCQCPRCLDPAEQGRLLRCVLCPSCFSLAMNPLPTPIKKPPAPVASSESEAAASGDGADESSQEEEDQNDSNSDGEKNGDGAQSSSSKPPPPPSPGMDQPEVDEQWQCSNCQATVTGTPSPRDAEKKVEELFLAAKQLLLDEEGTLAPAAADPAQVEKAVRLLEFCLQNTQLHASHYLKDMTRELLHAIFLECQMYQRALDMAPTLVQTASRIYATDHFEKGQLFETLAQLTTDAEGSVNSGDDAAASSAAPSLIDLRREYLEAAHHQYTTYFGETATPTIRLRNRLAALH